MIIDFAPRDFLTAFFRQKIKFIAAASFVLLIGIIYLLTTQPTFRSEGSLLIKFGKDATPDLSSPPNTWSMDVSRDVRNEIIESNIKILQSRSLLSSVLTEIGIEKVYPDLSKIEDENVRNDYAISQLLRGDLNVRAGQKDSIIQVSLGNKDPEIAAKFTQRLMELFIVRQSEVYNKPQTLFLSEQVKSAKSKLDQSTKLFMDFKNQNGISNIENELGELLRQKGETSKAAFEAVIDAQKTLSELQAQEAKMGATYRDSSPAFLRLRKSIAEAKEQLLNRQKELDSAQSPESGLSQQIQTIDRRIAYLESKQGTYKELEQQVDVDTESYKNYLLHTEGTRVTESLNQENITRISIVDEPTVPSKPERPRKKIVLFITLLAALMVAAGVSISLEVLDDTFSTAKQLARTLKEPVLATFNEDISDTELVKLYGAIENTTRGITSPILHFTSAYAGEGSSQVSLNLAKLVAEQVGKSVLFIDTIGNPEHFGKTQPMTPITKSISHPELLGTPTVIASLTQNLSYALFQENKSARVIFSNTEEVQHLFAMLRQKFDLVIINTEGFLTQTASMSFVNQVDAHIVVVEANRTRSPVANEVKSLISMNGGTLTGSVLNKRQLYIPTWLYKKLYS